VFQAKSNFLLNEPIFYKQGLDILLVRWDEARGIKRDEIYRYLSLPQKLKLLSQLPPSPLSDYFFAQSKVQQYIADYLVPYPLPKLLRRYCNLIVRQC